MKRIDDLFNNSEIKKVIDSHIHRDKAIKVIGDRVLIIDFSSVTRLNGEPLVVDDPEMQFSNNHFIVIETSLKTTYSSPILITSTLTYQQDLIIVNPKSNVQYRVNSGHVEILNKKVTIV